MKDMASYFLGIECHDGTANIFSSKHTNVSSKGVEPMRAENELNFVNLVVSDGERIRLSEQMNGRFRYGIEELCTTKSMV